MTRIAKEYEGANVSIGEPFNWQADPNPLKLQSEPRYAPRYGSFLAICPVGTEEFVEMGIGSDLRQYRFLTDSCQFQLYYKRKVAPFVKQHIGKLVYVWSENRLLGTAESMRGILTKGEKSLSFEVMGGARMVLR